MEKMSIGEMAALNHISIQTLRYYEKIGLFEPVFVDENTNYRYYNIKQSAKLDMIQYMKSLGMSLQKVKEQFAKADAKGIQLMLQEESQYFDKKIKELQQMKNAVEKCIKNYNRYFKAPKDGKILLQHIPQRKIYCYNVKENIYEHSLEGYEYILRELKNQIIIQNLPMIYFCNLGSIIRKEMVNSDQLISTEIFLFVDDGFELEEGIEVLPEGDYICIYCDSYWKEKEYAHKLFQYIKENRYEIIGDYICEVVVELPIFHQDERNMFIKLQLPVKHS